MTVTPWGLILTLAILRKINLNQVRLCVFGTDLKVRDSPRSIKARDRPAALGMSQHRGC